VPNPPKPPRGISSLKKCSRKREVRLWAAKNFPKWRGGEGVKAAALKLRYDGAKCVRVLQNKPVFDAQCEGSLAMGLR
jgi:hypothetical protein